MSDHLMEGGRNWASGNGCWIGASRVHTIYLARYHYHDLFLSLSSSESVSALQVIVIVRCPFQYLGIGKEGFSTGVLLCDA